MARPEKCCEHITSQNRQCQCKGRVREFRSAACLLRIQLFLLPEQVSKQASEFGPVLVYPFSTSVNTVEHLLCSRPGARGYGHGPCPRGDYFLFRGRELSR